MITKTKVTRRVLPLLVVAAALSVGGVFAADATGASTTKINAQQQVSQNWSGYVVHSSSGKSFSSVSGSWVQPTVNASSGAGSGYSAFWVGLGGSSQQSQSLEQVGTAADVSGGQTTYYAWYELVPAGEQKLNLTIHPGDHMSGKVTVNGTTVTVSLSDQTTGQSVTKTLQMSNPDTSSAEWIAEAPATQTPYGGYTILPLADYGKVTFTGASATADGHAGSIADPSWTVQRVDMSSAATTPVLGGGGRFNPPGFGASGQSTAGESAGAVSSDGSSFTVSYSSNGAAQATSGGGGYASGYPGYGYGGGYPGYGYPGYGSGYPGYVYPGD
jgi:hypothetical protein